MVRARRFVCLLKRSKSNIPLGVPHRAIFKSHAQSHEQIMTIASDGFVFVPRCVDDTTLQALRAEVDSLFRLKRSNDALSEDEYFDKGCALDFFTTRSLTENDEARVSMGDYMSRRNGLCLHQSDTSTVTPSSSASRGTSSVPTTPSAPSNTAVHPPRPARREDSAAVATADTSHTVDSPAPPWTEKHVSVVREAIFGTLARLARDALEAAPSSTKRHDAAGSDERPLLFNEQFVVKPPQSSIEFGWHTDEREQLAMCVFAPGAQPPVYVSVWLALDDCDAVNGCLEIFPQAWNRRRLHAPTEDEDGVLCLPAKAGAAVIFLSNVWHRSGPNQTDRPRRVYYAQYSLDVIRAAPSDPRALSLAVPCSPLSVCSTNVAPDVASPCDKGDADGGIDARDGAEARRLVSDRGEGVCASSSSGGVDGWSVGDGRRQCVDGEVTPFRASLPAVETRPKNSGSAKERASLSSSKILNGAEASRRRRRSEEESVKRDIGEEEEDRWSKRSRG